jgi:branched-subunit amino acid transport protein
VALRTQQGVRIRLRRQARDDERPTLTLPVPWERLIPVERGEEARVTGWVLIAVVGAATYAMRAAGPLTAGRLRLAGWLDRLLPYVMPAVLAGLVVTATFSSADRLVLDERAGGLAVAVVALLLRAPVLAVVVVAAAVTALLRTVG